MLNKLIVENFKIHKHLEIDLKKLTLLTGLNSSGKSSVIQSLLLLRQNQLNGNLSKGLNLSGNLCKIGQGQDALCQFAENDNIRFHISDSIHGVCEWTFPVKDEDLGKTYISYESDSISPSTELNLFSKKFHYIGISRWDPRESYPLDTQLVEDAHQMSSDKGQCDLMVHYLYHFGKEKPVMVPKELFCPGTESNDLLYQVSAWEGLISKNVQVVPKKEGKAYTLNYSYAIPNEMVGTQDFSAYNVGSGLTYVLPIIVALLSTPKDGLVIIENPEAHLHAKGQANLMKLIVAAAQYGIQIIIETHSDFVLNGVLINAKNFEHGQGGIDKDNVIIYHFEKDLQTQLSSAIPVHIEENGELEKQPNDFFEQMSLDINSLMGI